MFERLMSTENEAEREIVVRHRGLGTFWSRAFSVLGWLLAIGLFVWFVGFGYVKSAFGPESNYLFERYHSGDKKSDTKIAIINIGGVIQDGQGFIKKQIDLVRKDKDVKAVVVRINSPGGTVYGSDYILYHLNKLREEREIPMVVSMGSIAASGGYYVAMCVGDQEDSIFAEPTTTTGSIGVIIPHFNFADLMTQYGAEDDSIMSHPRKRMLSPAKKLTDEHRAILQDYVDQSFERFKKAILNGRPEFRKLNPDFADDDDSKQNPEEESSKIKIQNVESGRDLATGEIFTAADAEKHGLVDKLGFVEDAIERAKELAELETSPVRVVRYYSPKPWIDLPYLNQTNQHPLNQIFELSTPKAYFLASSLPPLIDTWDYAESPEFDK